MKLSIVGSGYVGLVTAACFAEVGNTVYCVDTDAAKIENLKKDILPIYESQLDEIVKRNRQAGNLRFTTRIEEALDDSDLCFIAVGTPMGPDGGADLQYVYAVAREIGQYICHKMLIVDKSTVPVGTAGEVSRIIAEGQRKRGVSHRFSVASNPEFLKEGSAVENCMRPDRVVIGTEDENSAKLLRELYSPFVRNHDRFILMDIASAEMTKYVANAMLATRISFMNEMANICEQVGADINSVRYGIGSDPRIGYSFLYAGCGYGGSCFPKDVQALIKTAKRSGCQSDILKSVEKVNLAQKRVLVQKVLNRFGEDLSGRRFAVWGLAFKPETDDMREAPSVVLINELTARGARVSAYDPKAVTEARTKYLAGNSSVEFALDKYSALDGVDALILVTEWKEFRSPDFSLMGRLMENKIIFDGRNQYNDTALEESGFECYQIGKANSGGKMDLENVLQNSQIFRSPETVLKTQSCLENITDKVSW